MAVYIALNVVFVTLVVVAIVGLLAWSIVRDHHDRTGEVLRLQISVPGPRRVSLAWIPASLAEAPQQRVS